MKTILKLTIICIALLATQVGAIQAATVTAAGAGGNYSLFIKSDGSLWANGYNNLGQLGDGTRTDRHTPEQIVPHLPLSILSFNPSGLNLVLSGSNGVAGGTYEMLMATNLSQPLSQWTSVATNVLSAGGNFTITATNVVDPNAPQHYYILQLQ